jgi:alkanesulfonate monooxygenase SsuD/methylene tetrahydromethanopterin reductase-like flavin-dependent oxidoreductase (luciferase family)
VRVTLDIPDEWINAAQEKMRTRGPEDTLRAAVRYVLGYQVFGWQNAEGKARFADWEEGAAAIEHLRREELKE